MYQPLPREALNPEACDGRPTNGVCVALAREFRVTSRPVEHPDRRVRISRRYNGGMFDDQKDYVLQSCRDRDIKFIRLWFTDILGSLKSFAITVEELVQALDEMGIGVEYSHHEVAPSQHEIDLRYTDALTMADNAMTYRLVVKEVALASGVYATFMPKPLANENGSGMHTHQSLFKGDRNAFFDASDQYHLSAIAKAYVAGVLRLAPEFTLVTRQGINRLRGML